MIWRMLVPITMLAFLTTITPSALAVDTASPTPNSLSESVKPTPLDFRPMPSGLNKNQPNSVYQSMGVNAAVQMWSTERMSEDGHTSNKENWFWNDYVKKLFNAKTGKTVPTVATEICRKLWISPIHPQVRFQEQTRKIEESLWRPSSGKNQWTNGCSKFLLLQKASSLSE